ncbi:MAG: hypothetical protein L6R38_005674 [Xanthoria sp. 2 TBL-2021]|nr:MAG: hypothetical protein L6R38_005674 [Xanthoria sp. 2 TBL-2021]
MLADRGFMTEKQDQENRDADIGRRERGCLPVSWEEDFVSGQQHQRTENRDANVSQVGLEARTEREIGDSLVEGRFSEAEVDDADADPALIAAGVNEVDDQLKSVAPESATLR